MRRARYTVLAVLAVIAVVAVVWAVLAPRQVDVDDLLAVYQPDQAYPGLEITYPLDQACFPPESVAPTFRWNDTASGAGCWVVAIARTGGHERLTAMVREPKWAPTEEQWATIKRDSQEAETAIAILGAPPWGPARVLSAGRVRIRTSGDPVGASIFYREVNLPFLDAVKDPSHIRWRFGDVASKEPPPIVLSNLPVCGNCHSFSADGATMGMDVDYANDKGSYAIVKVQPQIVLDKRAIITWNDYKREDGQLTFGLLSQVSPDGRYVVSTVKDRSVFVPQPGLAFSQLFFPVMGILAVYCRATGAIASLPGADDPAYVQSNAVWSPDGKTIVFTRSKAHRLKRVGHKVLLTRDECREFLDGKKPFRFDLYRIPFNNGKGGRAEPIPGASHNGMSNYFPKFSPDGKWVVFCRAKSFSLLQPDSELWIVPAEGGTARRMRCNTNRMNSWHSWSPNARWLVFSSKANGPYTQLWLTHVDEQGRSTPPILLERFTASDRAANIPEFVPTPSRAIVRIREQFLDEHSFFRAGCEFQDQKDLENAKRQFRKALALKPTYAAAHMNLALCLIVDARYQEALPHLDQAIRYAPNKPEPHFRRALILADMGDKRAAIAGLKEAIRLEPSQVIPYQALGRLLHEEGRLKESVEQLRKGVAVRPDNVDVIGYLGDSLLAAGEASEAAAQYRRVLALDPKHAGAMMRLAGILATADDPQLRNAEEAVRLATTSCELTGHAEPRALDVLAQAYAAMGRFAEAIQTATKACELASGAGDRELAIEILARVKRYRAGRPARAEGRD